MRSAIVTLVCGCVVAGLLAPGTAWGQEGDGSIVGWGNQVIGGDLSGGFAAVAGGHLHSLGLKADGSIVVWGYNNYGQCNMPAPNTDFVAVAAAYWHGLGLKADGSIVAWGNNRYGQCDVPAPNTGFTAVAAGDSHSLGIKGYPRGDLDHDGDVDLDDFNIFAGYMNGPEVTFPGGCDAADLDSDADVDLADFAELQTLFTGSR